MAQTRKRAREAREAARRAEVEAAAAKRERAARRRSLLPRLSLPRRTRRYGALPTRVRLQLVTLFFAVQVPVWVFVPATGARLVLAVLTAACLLVHVKTRRSPAR